MPRKFKALKNCQDFFGLLTKTIKLNIQIFIRFNSVQFKVIGLTCFNLETEILSGLNRNRNWLNLFILLELLLFFVTRNEREWSNGSSSSSSSSTGRQLNGACTVTAGGVVRKIASKKANAIYYLEGNKRTVELSVSLQTRSSRIIRQTFYVYETRCLVL